MKTRTTERPTRIEEVTPVTPCRTPRLDEWRWEGVLGYEEYLETIIRRDSERAARRAA